MDLCGLKPQVRQGHLRVLALASRGRLWTPANGSDQPPEQKASACAGAAIISAAATAALVPSAPGVSSRA